MRALWQPSRQHWREAWQALRAYPLRVALIAMPWLLGLLTGLPVLWYEMDRAVRTPDRQAAHDTVEYAAQTILRRMERLRDDTRFLAFLTPRLLETRSQGPLIETYTSFLMAGRDYHRVRWIDASGRERLRMDQDDGLIRRVADRALQDKRGRPFFEDSVHLQRGQVHLSALDLNVEYGRIEQPLRPTLRAASPFQLSDGSSGVVVVNLHGRLLLESLRERAAQSGFTLYVVRPDGYWLLGPSEDDAWGWQLDHPEHTLGNFAPALWAAMRKRQEGDWQDWSFSTLETAWHGSDGDLLAHSDPTLGQLRLLVHRSHPLAARWKAVLGGLALLSCGLALWVVMGQASALAREAAYMRRLREGNEALERANGYLQAAQQELARAERLSSLGLMVAGVAHEMNTPLASVQLALGALRGSVTRLQAQVQAGLRRSELEAFLAEAGQACELADNELRRASALVQRFKQVAVDRASLERRHFDLADVLLDADPRLRRTGMVDGVAVELELEAGIAMHTYPGPLQQVVANLFNNALLHGYPQGGPGRIRLTARRDGAAQVRIELADEGRGIAPEHLARIFEPFFTTSRNRGGTGLGLHIVHQIVTEVLGGRIEVRSHRATDPGDPPAGTCFTLFIPCEGPNGVAAPAA